MGKPQDGAFHENCQIAESSISQDRAFDGRCQTTGPGIRVNFPKYAAMRDSDVGGSINVLLFICPTWRLATWLLYQLEFLTLGT